MRVYPHPAPLQLFEETQKCTLCLFNELQNMTVTIREANRESYVVVSVEIRF